MGITTLVGEGLGMAGKADNVVDLKPTKVDSPPAKKDSGYEDLGLEQLSAKIDNEVSDTDFVKEQLGRIHKTATLAGDGSFRNLQQPVPLNIPAFSKYKANKDIRGLSDALRNISDYKFATDGSGVGGNSLMEEALGKPAWQHSGRKVQIVNMSPTEYLERAAKGHGIPYEELLQQIAQGDRTNSIIEGMAEGKQFQLPYLDFRDAGFGQEGQHRAMAAAMLGMDKIPVAVLSNGTKKADILEDSKGVKADAEAFLSEAEPTARERIEAQGFDTDGYWIHGTATGPAGAITEGALKEMTGFDGNRGVAGHFTLNPEFARIFSGDTAVHGHQPMSMPVHLKKNLGEYTFDKNNPSHLKDLQDRILEKAKEYQKGGPNEDSVIWKAMQEWAATPPRLIDFGWLENTKEFMEEAGYRAYLDFEDIGGDPTGIAVFNTDDVKSVFAPGKKAGTFGTALTAAVLGGRSNDTEAGNTQGTLETETSQIASDEGEVRNDQGEHISYLDSRNLLTGGIGHLMTAAEQKKYPKGTVIPKEQVDKWFKEDVEKHKKDVEKWDKKIPDMPEEARKIIFNMMFNMGPTKFRPSKWPGLTKALKDKDYNAAANEMVNSDWYNQVKSRGVRLVKRMRSLRTD